MHLQSYDVLVIGSGAAGLRAAIAASDQGARVGVLSKGSPGKKTATIFSGGVFAGSVGMASPSVHHHQTLKTGRGLNQIELVNILVSEGPQRLEELMRWGINAEFHDGYLFANGRPPLWGRAIVDCLVSRCSDRGIEFYPNLLVTRLRARQPGFEITTCSPTVDGSSSFSAKTVVLATGGAAALYARHDNPGRMLGDGWVLALDAGAVLQDLEFVQFYPLGLSEPGLPAFLIPPRLADRGRLYNHSGQDIYAKYNITERPAGEKARDKLSQALFREVYIENGTVWLDTSNLSDAQWREDPFSASAIELLGERYGARHHPVRVAPMAHHTMGGVVIDSHGATSIPGLFAAGEVTGGLHGANRMGGNALTETVVFGRRAGDAAAAFAQNLSDTQLDTKDQGPPESASEFQRPSGSPRFDPGGHLDSMRRSMWSWGGIVRNAAGLEQILDKVQKIKAHSITARPADARQAVQLLELRFAARASELILTSALQRTESRGAHYRQDYPAQNDGEWCAHLQVCQSPDGNLNRRLASSEAGKSVKSSK